MADEIDQAKPALSECRDKIHDLLTSYSLFTRSAYDQRQKFKHLLINVYQSK